MDFSLSEAMKYNMDGIKQALLSYDLMCQFWKNLEKRFEGNPYLTFPQAVHILRAIGLFHVHGHIDPCYVRFAPTFIPKQGWSMAKSLRHSGPPSIRSPIALAACQPLTAVKHLTTI